MRAGRFPIHDNSRSRPPSNVCAELSNNTNSTSAGTDTLVLVRDLESPRLLGGMVLAALAALLVCWPVWPGLMSFDSLLAYGQSIEGVQIADWPPMHDYLFYLSRMATGGPGGILAAQAFVLFFSASVIVSVFTQSRRRYLLGFALFVAMCFYFPTMLGTLIVNWKDVPLASFSLLAIALWLMAVRLSSRLLLALVSVPLTVAISVRLNSIPLVLPFLALLLLQPTGERRRGARTVACIVVVASISIAYASTLWRLPDMKRLPPLGHTFAGVQLWDIVGTSVCAGTNLLPQRYTGEVPLSIEDLRAIYDPRHIDLTLLPHAGARSLPRPDGAGYGELARAWEDAIRNHPLCYFHHRAAVFAHQMGFTEHIFIPTHGGIDANAYGISFRDPDAATARILSVATGADAWPRRPFWLYLVAAIATAFAVARGRNSVPVVLLLGLGAILYVASFTLLAPAADARYIFASNIYCALLLVVALVSDSAAPAAKVLAVNSSRLE
jgi:hypothetical protein